MTDDLTSPHCYEHEPKSKILTCDNTTSLVDRYSDSTILLFTLKQSLKNLEAKAKAKAKAEVSQSAAAASLSLSPVPPPTSSSSTHLEERDSIYTHSRVSGSKESASTKNLIERVDADADAASFRNATTCTENKTEPAKSATTLFLKELLIDCKSSYVTTFEETLRQSSDLIHTSNNNRNRSSGASKQEMAAWIGTHDTLNGDTDNLHVSSKQDLGQPFMSGSAGDSAVSLESPLVYTARLSSASGDSSTSSSSECEVSAHENCFDFAPQKHVKALISDKAFNVGSGAGGYDVAHNGYTCPPRSEWGKMTTYQFLASSDLT